MPKMSTLAYNAKQGVKNIKRNGMFTIASIGTMTACLFLFGIFYFLIVNLRSTMQSAETSVGVSVFFDEGISETVKSEIGVLIRNRSEVASCRYVSVEEAWESYKEKYISEENAKSFGDDNPLEDSDSYEVTLNDVTKQKELVEYISSIKGVRSVLNSQELADWLSTVKKAVTYVSGAIVIILLCVAAFLISTTVTTGISVRKQELSIMKLIGASDRFIRAPFVVEGVIIGTIGAIIPLGILYLLYYKILDMLSQKLGSGLFNMEFVDIATVFSTLIPVSLAIGIGIGFLGSSLTVKRELKKIY